MVTMPWSMTTRSVPLMLCNGTLVPPCVVSYVLSIIFSLLSYGAQPLVAAAVKTPDPPLILSIIQGLYLYTVQYESGGGGQ
jgi:hypothetical protein